MLQLQRLNPPLYKALDSLPDLFRERVSLARHRRSPPDSGMDSLIVQLALGRSRSYPYVCAKLRCSRARMCCVICVDHSAGLSCLYVLRLAGQLLCLEPQLIKN